MPKEKKPFVDFRDIRSRITMEQVLEHYGVLDKFTRNGSRLSGPCPIHHGTNPTQFRVDTEKNIWNCFSECKHGGNVLDFIAKKEDVSIHEAAIKACEWFNIPIDEVKAKGSSKNEPEQSREHRAKAQQKSKSAPQPESKSASEPLAKAEGIGSNKPLGFTLQNLDPNHAYLAERGLTPEPLKRLGCTSLRPHPAKATC